MSLFEDCFKSPFYFFSDFFFFESSVVLRVLSEILQKIVSGISTGLHLFINPGNSFWDPSTSFFYSWRSIWNFSSKFIWHSSLSSVFISSFRNFWGHFRWDCFKSFLLTFITESYPEFLKKILHHFIYFVWYFSMKSFSLQEFISQGDRFELSIGFFYFHSAIFVDFFFWVPPDGPSVISQQVVLNFRPMFLQ